MYLTGYWSAFEDEPALCPRSTAPLLLAPDTDPIGQIDGYRSSGQIPVYCKGASVYHDLNLRLASSTGGTFRDAPARRVFEALLRELYWAFRDETISRADLVALVRERLPSIVEAEAGVDPREAEALVDAWEARDATDDFGVMSIRNGWHRSSIIWMGCGAARHRWLDRSRPRFIGPARRSPSRPTRLRLRPIR